LPTLDQPSVALRALAAPRRPLFPMPIRLRSRKYWRRSALDSFKRQLQDFALGVQTPVPPRGEADPLIPSSAVAAEFGICTRTLDRWIAETHAAGVEKPDA
jgi:hypothetical protein